MSWIPINYYNCDLWELRGITILFLAWIGFIVLGCWSFLKNRAKLVDWLVFIGLLLLTITGVVILSSVKTYRQQLDSEYIEEVDKYYNCRVWNATMLIQSKDGIRRSRSVMMREDFIKMGFPEIVAETLRREGFEVKNCSITGKESNLGWEPWATINAVCDGNKSFHIHIDAYSWDCLK